MSPLVLTLCKKVTAVTPRSTPRPQTTSSMCAQVAAMHNYTAAPSSEPTSNSSTPNKKRKHGGSSHQGSAVKRVRVNGAADSNFHSVVRKLQQHGQSSHHRGGQHSKVAAASSRSSSDSEDTECRRAQHNVLERKRRNDLKSSFHALRAKVPELSSHERAPKVVILKKATEYIWSLRKTRSHQLLEMESLKRQNEALQESLAVLRQ